MTQSTDSISPPPDAKPARPHTTVTTYAGPIRGVARGIYDGPHATPPRANSGPVFLGIKNITPDGRLDLSEIRHVSEEHYPRWIRRVEPQANDIVFSYEATLHRYAIIPQGFRGCLGRRLGLIRPNEDRVIPRFLHYYLLSTNWRSVVGTHVVNGATVDRIPILRFPEFQIRIPDLQTQRSVVSILAAYDDLIENNRRRIRLLEQAARMIYEGWFVRLRFPGRTGVDSHADVPMGWAEQPLGSICRDVREGVNPKTLTADTAYIGLEHIPRRSITLIDWASPAGVGSTKFKFLEGDILFGKIRPYLHKVGFALVDGITSSDSIVVRPTDPDLYEYLLLLLSSDQFVALASKTVREGSKMPRADWKFLLKSAILVPGPQHLDSFREVIRPVLDQLRNLAWNSRRLAQARDLLLPRLMSGEISA